jgi:mRNA interferase HicA
MGVAGALHGVALRTFLSDTATVKGSELVRRLRRVGRKRGVEVLFVTERGKGSHGTLYFGSSFTIVRDLKDELKTGTLHAMLKQLGLTLKDIEG